MKKSPDILIDVSNAFSAIGNPAAANALLIRRETGSSTADAVKAALKALPHGCKGARVVVFSSDFFKQTVRLPAAQTRGLSRSEILSMLAFEIEPFSSIPRDAGQIAFSPAESSGDFNSFETLQITTAEISAVFSAVRAAGASLSGLAYANDDLSAADETSAATILAAKAKELAAPSGVPIPFIEAQRTGSGVNLLQLGIALSVLAATLCLCHFLIERSLRVKESAELAKREPIAAEITRTTASISEIGKKIIKVQTTAREREEMAHRLSFRVGAWLSLLTALPKACHDDTVIKSITGAGSFSANISSFSATDSGAVDFAARLSKLAAPSGWSIQPIRVSLSPSLKDAKSGSSEFSAKFDDTAVQSAAPSPNQPGGRP